MSKVGFAALPLALLLCVACRSTPPMQPTSDSSSSTHPGKALFARVTHRFTVPPERVYDAFLDVATARRFLYASKSGEVVRAELDPRVGGAYVIVDRRDGADVEHSGKFLELDRPRRIVYTFFVPGYSTNPDRVTVEIAPKRGGCELTLTHEMEPDYAPFIGATVSAYEEHLKRLDELLAK